LLEKLYGALYGLFATGDANHAEADAATWQVLSCCLCCGNALRSLC